MQTIDSKLLTFLSDLAANNDRDWFTANKKRYEQDLKDPALAFIAEFAGPLHDISPHFEAIPKAVGGSLFRIFRDTRFSKDKTPYKTHTGIQFRHASTSNDVHAPGFYLHLAPGDSGVGVGMWMPPNPVLGRVRDRIANEPETWAAVKQAVLDAGMAFMDSDSDLKRVPRGYDADHVHADDLRRKSIAVHRKLTDAEVTAPDFQMALAGHFAAAAPLVEYLCDTLDLPY